MRLRPRRAAQSRQGLPAAPSLRRARPRPYPSRPAAAPRPAALLMTLLKPADAQSLRDAVAWAAEASQPIELVAGGSKRGLGRPLQVAHTLDLSALSGIVAYEPSELVLTARAATPLGEIVAALDSHHHMLAFEPPDWGGLLDTPARHTLCGGRSCKLAGPRPVHAR